MFDKIVYAACIGFFVAIVIWLAILTVWTTGLIDVISELEIAGGKDLWRVRPFSHIWCD